jgi:protein archease
VSPPFRLLEHTADLGIEATGGTAEEVLEQAALALTTILTGREHPHTLGRPERELRFFVEATDREALAVAFLSELLWHFESQDLLWLGGGVRLHEGKDGLMRADAEGNAIVHDPSRHGQGVEVKAVTYHDLSFGREGKAWRLRVILDI